jgi:hypothetical protein
MLVMERCATSHAPMLTSSDAKELVVSRPLVVFVRREEVGPTATMVVNWSRFSAAYGMAECIRLMCIMDEDLQYSIQQLSIVGAGTDVAVVEGEREDFADMREDARGRVEVVGSGFTVAYGLPNCVRVKDVAMDWRSLFGIFYFEAGSEQAFPTVEAVVHSGVSDVVRLCEMYAGTPKTVLEPCSTILALDDRGAVLAGDAALLEDETLCLVEPEM